MDPAAIKELQRLYALKYGKPASKKRKLDPAAIEADAENDSSDTLSDEGNSDTELEDGNESADESLQSDDDDLDLPPAVSQEDAIEVVTFDDRMVNPTQDVAVEGYQAFRAGKVPKKGSLGPTDSKSGEVDDEEADNLRLDKELNKLLRESDLLRQQGDGSLETSGKYRLKAMEAQRIRNGAAKPKQQKMPIGMRKGIEAAAANRVAVREKFEKDNGIVTAHKSAPVKKRKSNKTLHELNLGKYKNGKLSISRTEIARINGTQGGASQGKKKRGFRDFSNIG